MTRSCWNVLGKCVHDPRRGHRLSGNRPKLNILCKSLRARTERRYVGDDAGCFEVAPIAFSCQLIGSSREAGKIETAAEVCKRLVYPSATERQCNLYRCSRLST